MKVSIKKAGNSGAKFYRLVIALALASVIGGTAFTPAFADNDGDHGDRGNRHRHRHHVVRSYYPEYGRSYGYYYGYSQPVYVPPPVYYPPEQSPGINLIFPVRIH